MYKEKRVEASIVCDMCGTEKKATSRGESKADMYIALTTSQGWLKWRSKDICIGCAKRIDSFVAGLY